MWDVLHSFGIGIGFSVGVLSGATLCQLATRAGRQDFAKAVEETNRMTEQRLREYVANTDRIAAVLERFEMYRAEDKQA